MEELEGSTPEQVTEVSTEGTPAPESQGQPESVLDLDSVEKFKYGGREWTPKDLQGSLMMQSDYTKKTQALSEERKFYDNLAADLDQVKTNPGLVERFKSIYPEKFHSYLRYVQQAQSPSQKQNPSATPGMDPDFVNRFNRLESQLKTQEVEKISAQLDATFSKLSEKYPFADEEAVIARGQALLNRGEQLNEKVWDILWKSVNEKNESIAKKFYAQKQTQQKQANASGKDSAPGGGMPGQAPKLPRTIKEASEFALREIENS